MLLGAWLTWTGTADISGFNEGYIESESNTGIYFDLANAGFAVIAFDYSGFGTRGYEFNGAAGGPQGGDGLPLFYRRYPTWSLLGKIVHDGLAAVDLAVRNSGHNSYPGDDPPNGLPGFDLDRIYAVGYDVGGRAALYMGALDPHRRLKGIVSVNGFTPMRTDTNSSSTGGIRRLWDWHALQPVLGFFDGQEATLPYDMDDVMAEVGDTPMLVYQQTYDRANNAKEVAAAVSKAKSAGANVSLVTADTVNMLNDAAHAAVISFLKIQAGVNEKWPRSGPPDAYPNVGLVACGATGDGPGLPKSLRWKENITDGTLRETEWHEALTISCAQAAASAGVKACGALAVDEHIALSRLTHSPDPARWNDTLNLQWAVDKGFVREARGKCLSAPKGGSSREVVASSKCGASDKWEQLATYELRHLGVGKCLGVW